MIAITFALYFAIERQPPVNFFSRRSRAARRATPHEVAMVNHVFYLDRSKVGLYLQYVGNLAHGDFGDFLTIQDDKVVDAGPIDPPYGPLRATLSILVGGAISRAASLTAARGDLRQPDRLVGRPNHLVRRAHPRLLSPDDARPDPRKRRRSRRLAADERLLHVHRSRHGADHVSPPSSPCGGPVDWATH